MMIQETATVLWNQKINSGYSRIGLTCTSQYAKARPGQFVTLRFPEQNSPFLRRPFSIHRLIGQGDDISGIEILYKIVGQFTQKLSLAKQGDQVDLLGPLGHGFTLSDSIRNVAFVAGGIGVAPLIFLYDALVHSKISFSESAVFIGGRSQVDILCKSVFNSTNIKLHTITEDGSEGEKGLVTMPLTRWLKTHHPDIIYACGPMPMLKVIIAIAKLENISCEVSVETIMACGIGACLGCAIQTNQEPEKYRHVCVDGPVFNAADLYTG
jgi:dihydroorotate dehydrogenase electron transfer subunit